MRLSLALLSCNVLGHLLSPGIYSWVFLRDTLGSGMANREQGCQPHWALSSGSHKQCIRNPACPRFYQYLVLPDFNFHPPSVVQLTLERERPWSLRSGVAFHFVIAASSPENFCGFPVLSGHCSLTVLSEFFCKPHVLQMLPLISQLVKALRMLPFAI